MQFMELQQVLSRARKIFRLKIAMNMVSDSSQQEVPRSVSAFDTAINLGCRQIVLHHLVKFQA